MTVATLPPSTTDAPAINHPTRSEPAPPPRDRGRLATLVRGRPGDPAWTRPAVLTLLAATGLLYLWNLSASGYANSFYAAAVQSGSVSWKAWFFGSLDSASSITVDKPPAALWIMGLSARVFGFNSWSLLAPQALEGVAAVGLLYATVRRWSGPIAGLIAGAALALTPAAVLMFRFDNPDALLVLLMVGAAYALTRALERAGTRWLLACGALIGFAFLTKMMQGFLVLPAFALVYLIAAPTSLGRRIWQVLSAGAAVVVAAGWWVLAVGLWPASSRPYIGGSTNNSVLNLVFGYNGLGRLFGSAGNGGGGGGGTGAAGSSFGGATGLDRLFSSEMGNEISWLLLAALVALVAGLWATRRAPRTDRTRAALILWGGWLIVTGLVFSYMEGTIHPYYTVALAPAVAALIAVGGAALLARREQLTARLSLAAMVVAAGGWSYMLLARTASWHPELRYVIAVITVLAALGFVVPPNRLRRGAQGVVVTGVIAGIIGTGAFGLATAASAHTGSIPSVGPAAASTGIGFGGGTRPTGATSGQRPTGQPPTGTGTAPTGTAPTGSGGTASGGTASVGSAGDSGGSTTTSTALTTALKASTTTWAAAVVGDQSAADLELTSGGAAVMAIGGWSGSDNSPTLAQFEKYVAAGKIHYFVSGSGQGSGPGGGQGGTSSVGSQITAWVKAHYTATTIGGQTVYDLTKAATK